MIDIPLYRNQMESTFLLTEITVVYALPLISFTLILLIHQSQRSKFHSLYYQTQRLISPVQLHKCTYEVILLRLTKFQTSQESFIFQGVSIEHTSFSYIYHVYKMCAFIKLVKVILKARDVALKSGTGLSIFILL